MTDLWVARDADGGYLGLYPSEPRQSECKTIWLRSNIQEDVQLLPMGWFPDLKPGECRRLVMEEEKSE